MKIVAASCCKLQTTNPQAVRREILAERPDVLLLGDNIYPDHDTHDDPAALSAELQRLQGAQLAEPGGPHDLGRPPARPGLRQATPQLRRVHLRCPATGVDLLADKELSLRSRPAPSPSACRPAPPRHP